MIKCEHCSSVLKSETNFKLHLVNSKKCLKLRGLKLETKFICKGCNENFMNNVNLAIHCDSCKRYHVLLATEDLIKDKNQMLETIIKLQNIQQSYFDLKNENDDLSLKHNELKFSYKELSKQYEELKQQYEKTINKLEMKISQCDSFIQTIAREGNNKPTTV